MMKPGAVARHAPGTKQERTADTLAHAGSAGIRTMSLSNGAVQDVLWAGHETTTLTTELLANASGKSARTDVLV